MSVVINNIGLLVTNDPSVSGDGLGQIRDAAVVIDGDRIVWVGRCAEAPAADYQADMTGACIIPGFVDSHSHPVFAGDRSDEFDARMNGQKYEAGGILRTVRRTREASVGLLDAVMTGILDEMALGGTTTVEAKTGYGLDVETEVKLALRGPSPGRTSSGPSASRTSTSVWCAGRCCKPYVPMCAG